MNVYNYPTFSHNTQTENQIYVFHLRSFGHQGTLYFVFLDSDPLKTSREYAVFTLRTRGPKCAHAKHRVKRKG